MSNASHANIRCSSIIEVLGKPKEHVEESIKSYIEKLKADVQYIVLKEEFSKTVEQENGLFNSYVEVEFLVKGLPALSAFCFNYMPASLEIIKPEKIDVKSQNLSALLNDFQSRLHAVDMMVKRQKNENEFLRLNLRSAIKNSIVLSLKLSPLSLDQLAKTTGIKREELQPFVDELLSEEKISHDEEICQIRAQSNTEKKA